jgi:hypothetical protein
MKKLFCIIAASIAIAAAATSQGLLFRRARRGEAVRTVSEIRAAGPAWMTESEFYWLCRLAAASVSGGTDDEWCPGHGSFSQRRLKSDCVICRGEYMPEQTVSAGAGQSEDEADLLKWAQTPHFQLGQSERQAQVERVLLARRETGAGQVPADTIEKAREAWAELLAAMEEHHVHPSVAVKVVGMDFAVAALAAVRTPEEQT